MHLVEVEYAQEEDGEQGLLYVEYEGEPAIGLEPPDQINNPGNPSITIPQ